MGRRQQHLYRTEPARFPTDFPVRLAEFGDVAGLSWRELARLLRVNVRTVHRWRRGARPDAGHMLALLELAAERDLLHTIAPGLAPRPTTGAHGTDCPAQETKPLRPARAALDGPEHKSR